MVLIRVLCVVAATLVVSTHGVAPGDQQELCGALRTLGVVPTPDYDPTMVILMDSWNYQNLLPPQSGAVWQQVDNDTNNDVQFTTNVSTIVIAIQRNLTKTDTTGIGTDSVAARARSLVESPTTPLFRL